MSTSTEVISTESWDAYENTNANSALERMPICPDEFSVGAASLKRVFWNLKSLCVPNPEEIEIAPSQWAIAHAFDILEGTAYAMSYQQGKTRDQSWAFPKGYVIADDTGGIRVEWWHARSHCVTLVIGNSEQSSSYLFVKFGSDDAGKMIRPPHPNQLAKQLSELNKAMASAANA
jgi:hypothetical protein